MTNDNLFIIIFVFDWIVLPILSIIIYALKCDMSFRYVQSTIMYRLITCYKLTNEMAELKCSLPLFSFLIIGVLITFFFSTINVRYLGIKYLFLLKDNVKLVIYIEWLLILLFSVFYFYSGDIFVIFALYYCFPFIISFIFCSWVYKTLMILLLLIFTSWLSMFEI